MPCFLVGKTTAELLGKAWGVPVEHFSHQQGHIAAALYSAGKLDWMEQEFLAFHISGAPQRRCGCALMKRDCPK